MGVVDELVRAREAYDRRDWVIAYEALSSAGATVADDFDRLGAAAHLLGRRNDCAAAYQRAYQAHLDAGAPLAAVRSACALGYVLVTGGESAVAGGWMARAERLLEPVAEDVVEHGHVVMIALFREIGRGDWEAAMGCASRISSYGRRFGDPDLLAVGLASEGRLATRSGRVREGLALLDEAMVELTTGSVSPMVAGDVYCSMIEACQDLSDFERAAQWTSTLSAFCESQPGLVPFTGQCAVHRGQIMRVRGAYAEALEEFRRACSRYLADEATVPAGQAHAEEAEVLRLQGEYGAAEECYAEAVACGFDPQPGLALLWLARGREPDALAAVERVLGEPRDQLGRSQALPGAVTVLLALGLLDQAAGLAAEVRAIATEVGTPALSAMAGYAEGSLLLATGDPAGAAPLLRRASQLWADQSAPYEVARCRLGLGRALLSLGDAASAAGELTAARTAFAALGAGPAEREAADLLVPDAPSGLSPRELEVLRLVAAGRTNPEIAAMLVLSEKTVARHLSNIFGKIGVPTRTAAAAYAFENRIV